MFQITADDLGPDLTKEIKNDAGGLMITAAVTLFIAGGPLSLVALGAGFGLGLCLNAARAHTVKDYGNMKYWEEAAPTIILSVISMSGDAISTIRTAKILRTIGGYRIVKSQFAISTAATSACNDINEKQNSYFKEQ